jgi:hypothetical protein
MRFHSWVSSVAIALVAGLASSCATVARSNSSPDVEPPGDPREALLDAVGFGEADAVERLLTAGGEADQLTPEGFTLLMIAAEDGHDPVVASLLEHGANPNAKTDQAVTPLILASSRGNVSTAEELIARGADTTAVTRAGVTPLMGAAAAGHADAVKMLLRHGAVIDARDEGGRREPCQEGASRGRRAAAPRIVSHARQPARPAPVADDERVGFDARTPLGLDGARVDESVPAPTCRSTW